MRGSCGCCDHHLRRNLQSFERNPALVSPTTFVDIENLDEVEGSHSGQYQVSLDWNIGQSLINIPDIEKWQTLPIATRFHWLWTIPLVPYLINVSSMEWISRSIQLPKLIGGSWHHHRWSNRWQWEIRLGRANSIVVWEDLPLAQYFYTRDIG